MKIIALLLLGMTSLAVAASGPELYRQHCGSCHDHPVGRAPALAAVKAMSSAAILRAMESGPMRVQAKDLSPADRMSVAIFLTGGFFKLPQESEPPQSAFCAAGRTAPFNASWNGFGATRENTRFQSAGAAGLTAQEVPRLKLRWAFSLGDVTEARGQPVVVGGRLFVTTVSGKLFALDPRSGCIIWRYAAEGPIRLGVVAGTAGSHPAVFFGDALANGYAVAADTGALLWKVHLESHYAAIVTAIPATVGGRVFFGISSMEEVTGALADYQCCSFRGSVVAVDAATGRSAWQTHMIADAPVPTTRSKTDTQLWGPSGAPVWTTATVDTSQHRLYVATGNAYSAPAAGTTDAVVALDERSGKMLWSRQFTPGDVFTTDCEESAKTNCPTPAGPDFDFGQPPVLVTAHNGHRMLVIGQKSGVAFALDPDRNGAVLWERRLGRGGSLGGLQWGGAVDSSTAYFALSDIGFKEEANGESALNPALGGGLFGVDLHDGRVRWHAAPVPCARPKCSPAQSAAVSGIPGVVFSGSVDGHLRAYATDTGKVIWDMDTQREYTAVNGGTAKGGAIDASGAAIAGGMLFAYSGYGQWGAAPGNALLAFSVEGK